MKWRTLSHAGVLGLTVLALCAISMHAQDRTPKGEWRYYSGDNGAKKYSPLDQINKDNVAKLGVAWRRPHVDPELLAGYQGQPLRLSNNFRSTPITVNGVLYASNAVGLVEAFDPGTGKTIWLQKPGPEGIRGGTSNEASRTGATPPAGGSSHTAISTSTRSTRGPASRSPVSATAARWI